MNIIILLYVGVALVGITLGAALVYITGPERRLARSITLCHKKITWAYDFSVFCHLDYGHSGECCAPLSEFEKAGYAQPPF